MRVAMLVRKPPSIDDVARQAQVGALYLIHYPTGRYQQPNLVEDAQKQFQGPVRLAEDFMEIDFN